MCVCVTDFEFIQMCMWSSERPSVCVWSVYVFACVSACTRLVISDKGHGEWQGGQPAGVCQWSGGVNSGLSDRDCSQHSGHSCSRKSNDKVAVCGRAVQTMAAMWRPCLYGQRRSHSVCRPAETTTVLQNMSDIIWNIVHPDLIRAKGTFNFIACNFGACLITLFISLFLFQFQGWICVCNFLK